MATDKSRRAQFKAPKGPGKSFSKHVDDAMRAGIPAVKGREAVKWMAEYARKLTVNPSQLIRQENKNLVNTPIIGGLYCFFYDPKLKKTLPYYDRFPMIFVINLYDDGWLGINIHYLPYQLRAKLMDALYDLEVGTNSRNKKLQVTYQILNSASKYRWFKPCVKRYLKGHVRSRLLKVPYEHWAMATMLPLQQFEKKSGAMIWNDSRTKIGK